MSRPKEHDERTAAALLDAAERIAEQEGPAALSVRRVANEIDTTTRAVYSLFGSKDSLVVALGVRAFQLLGAAIETLPRTSDPVTDLVRAGLAFRCFARDHPALFRIGVQRLQVSGESVRGFVDAANIALSELHARVERLRDADQLGHRSVPAAAWEFHALCEGLAAIEARCIIDREEAEGMWTDALSSLIDGWSANNRLRGNSALRV
jgi:AcrR family transcriptional regulator